MRVSIPLIKAAIAAATLAAMVGCSMPSWHGVGSKKNNPTASLANAPVAPSFNPAAPSPPTVTLGPGQTAATGTLPTYPGTNYPVTPYPTAAPNGVATTPNSYAAAPQGGAPTSYSAAPAAAPGAAASPYSAYPTASPYSTTAPPAGTYNASVPNSTYR